MIAALSLWLTLSSQTASANFVSYVDEKGTRHIVQSVEEIPEQYRDKAKESRAGDASNSKAGPDGVQKRPASSSKGRVGGRGKRKGAAEPAPEQEAE